ncbi:hypothetical protein [Grimontia sedimenti]|uniref:hypothetical protein n=1 Tax=Grimontia sedimenti TaxID=2711294 RepID=UPI001F1CE8FF|nr:hypothetical protein [Grimontia sedimenti]
MNSIAFRLHLSLITLTVLLLTVSSLTVWVALNTRSSTDALLDKALPNTINTIHMVDELSEMLFNLMRYVEEEDVEGHTAFLQHLTTFVKHKQDLSVSKGLALTEDISQLRALHQTFLLKAQDTVFNVFDPTADQRARSLVTSTSQPLEALLDKLHTTINGQNDLTIFQMITPLYVVTILNCLMKCRT